MATSFSWGEGNGTATSGAPTDITTLGAINSGSPYNVAATDINWKNQDSCTAAGGGAYSSFPIQAGNNSYTKNSFGYISGTYNQVSNGGVYQSAGTLGTGLTLMGQVTSTYSTPSTTTVSGGSWVNMNTTSSGSPITLEFNTTSPWASSPTSTLSASATAYTQIFESQLQTTTSASPGDCATITITIVYNEN